MQNREQHIKEKEEVLAILRKNNELLNNENLDKYRAKQMKKKYQKMLL